MSNLVEHFRLMARNNHWSNYRLHRACTELPEAEYFRDRRAFFRSIHGTLNHILLIDGHYLARLAGDRVDRAHLNQELYSDLRSLRRAQERSDRQLIAVCDGLRQERLDAAARWTDKEGQVHSETVHIVLAHLFMHQIHHRGQVHGMLSAAAASPPQLDEFFLSQDASLRQAEVEQLGLEL